MSHKSRHVHFTNFDNANMSSKNFTTINTHTQWEKHTNKQWLLTDFCECKLQTYFPVCVGLGPLASLFLMYTKNNICKKYTRCLLSHINKKLQVNLYVKHTYLIYRKWQRGKQQGEFMWKCWIWQKFMHI